VGACGPSGGNDTVCIRHNDQPRDCQRMMESFPTAARQPDQAVVRRLWSEASG
jgi:hypothetical protein